MGSRASRANWPIIGCVIVGLSLSGCAGVNANDPNLSPAERELRAQTNRFSETVATGAIAGCVLGAALGAAIGGARGALIGCGGGALAGGTTGYYVASQNQQYASNEAALNGRIAAAQNEAQSFQAIAMTSETITAQNLAQIAQLKQQVGAGKLTAEQYKTQTARMQQDVDLLKTAQAELQKTQGHISSDASTMQAQGLPTSQLSAASAQIEAARQQISTNTDAMVRALAG